MDTKLQKVDHGALKANQIVIIVLNILAFVLNLPWLAALVAAFMLIGTFLGLPGFILVYRSALKPLGLVKPDILLDNPEPHRFAQGFGGVVIVLGLLALFAGYTILGWGLVWLVIALAALNAFGGFCVGCFVYYWLTRIGVPGFSKQPPIGTFPGMRPKGSGTNGS
ncbi:MAG TPA: DUF4395 domain-containing protein [Anaerolineales bacterium]|jgi:uncharacterized membrane protein